MFDTRTNSVKKTVEKLEYCCSLQKSNYKTNNMSKLIVKESTLTDNNKF